MAADRGVGGDAQRSDSSIIFLQTANCRSSRAEPHSSNLTAGAKRSGYSGVQLTGIESGIAGPDLCYARRKRDWRLAITGMRGFFAEALDKPIMELNGSSIPCNPRVGPADELLRLYSGAGVHLSVHLRRVRMPVLEAIAAGIPVACSDIAPLREVAVMRLYFFGSHERRRNRQCARSDCDGCAAARPARASRSWSAPVNFRGSACVKR